MEDIYSQQKRRVKNHWFTVRVEKGELDLMDKVAAKLKIDRATFVNYAVKKELAEATAKLFR